MVFPTWIWYILPKYMTKYLNSLCFLLCNCIARRRRDFLEFSLFSLHAHGQIFTPNNYNYKRVLYLKSGDETYTLNPKQKKYLIIIVVQLESWPWNYFTFSKRVTAKVFNGMCVVSINTYSLTKIIEDKTVGDSSHVKTIH